MEKTLKYQVWVEADDYPSLGLIGWKMVEFFSLFEGAEKWTDEWHRSHDGCSEIVLVTAFR